MKTKDPEMFFKYTRMLPDQFDSILCLLKPKLLKHSRREYLSPALKLAMTLKFLAHGGSFQSLSWEFRVGHSTVSKVIFETCTAIWDTMQPIYLKSPTEQEWINISHQFSNRWNFPHTLVAIDGKHVHIQCPLNSGSLYYNYKNHFSIILLACCDADYKFIWADIGAYGSEHDASVFRRSQMGKQLDEGSVQLPKVDQLPSSNVEMPYFFVGDEAFPLKPYLMRPYPGRQLTEQKSVFNYRLSRARRVIENSFGILASRWRVYRSPLLCSIKTTEAVVKATICLHNYLKTDAPTTYVPPTLIDSLKDDGGTNRDGEWREIIQNDTNWQSGSKYISQCNYGFERQASRIFDIRCWSSVMANGIC
ncbi:unnamed protein product [Acanthoscelides obtectus]|uniref:DDE Tnp4 domain-containing protein n=2 Tax=Acanthoscelides obtectus TaxID=200917 RepID=A0A9P0LX22_ACAOB|nr:unnamed protein product [Acanthoscelides obtectus]CAK1650723.1 Protein ALP1-like [Acanthoscelides obtectus]